MTSTAITFVGKNLSSHPVLLKASGKAVAMLRNLSLKSYLPKQRRREFAAAQTSASIHAVRSSIYRERGSGTMPTIVVGGFVPDATEVVEFQRPLLKEFGAVYYMNYPRNGFSEALFFAQLADLIEDINSRGERPVLFGISFGAGIIARFIRTGSATIVSGIRGLALISPVLCTEDLVRPAGERSGGVRMLESNLRRILNARSSDRADVEKQIERARRCFSGLFGIGAENRQLGGRHLAIRNKIMNTIEKTPFLGGYERVLALQSFTLPKVGSLFSGPVLTLLAESEENLLVPTSPTLEICGDRNRFLALFPKGRCSRVSSGDADDPVAHASLIFHHEQFNEHISTWYSRLLGPKMFAAI
jgi:pimeloyl-ACP methyl ester carboxylesterase